MQVGEVSAYDLTDDGEKIKADIFIYKKYHHLVRQSSVFWKTGGIKLEASLEKGLKLESGTMTSLISGGITFANGAVALKEKKAAKKKYNIYPL